MKKGRMEMERLHNQVIKRYHTLCSMLSLSETEKEALLIPYGVTSSKDMDTNDLINVCGFLSKQIDNRNSKEHSEYDKARKRVIAVMSKYFALSGYKYDVEAIKSIASRIVKAKSFNNISIERLRNIYNLFRNKIKDMEKGKELLSNIKKVKDKKNNKYNYKTNYYNGREIQS